MKEYTDPYELIADHYPSLLDILTEDQQDYLRYCLDFQCVALKVHDGKVDVVDTISEDIINTFTIETFVRYTLADAVRAS